MCLMMCWGYCVILLYYFCSRFVSTTVAFVFSDVMGGILVWCDVEYVVCMKDVDGYNVFLCVILCGMFVYVNSGCVLVIFGLSGCGKILLFNVLFYCLDVK